MKKKFPSLHLNADDFIPATNDEKESLVVMRDSVNFWADGMRRLRKNKIAMISLVFILIIMFFAYVMPAFWPYSYEQQIKYSENLKPFEYSQTEQARIDAGEKVFPHICAALVLIVGSIFGAVAGFAGGWVDIIMMRITDILYTIPDVLLIIVLSLALKPRLEDLAEQPGFGWMNTVGPNLIAIFLVFVLLYWVGMARITRSQILVLKESEYVTAARALGASSSRIIRKHLLTNCIGTLIVTTTLQIPSAIFTESYLSFLGLGVAAPMPSLGSLATDAVKGMNTYPHLLFLPAILISVIILAFNLFGDGLRDAFDPKLKN